MHNQLQLFKTALSKVEIISFTAEINENDRTQFCDHSQMLAHLREKVLPFFETATVYNFDIEFRSHKNAVGTVTAEILQMHPISHSRCSFVAFDYRTFRKYLSIQLPVAEISAWLSRNLDGNNQQKEKRTLFFDCHSEVQNVVEICNHFKEVGIIACLWSRTDFRAAPVRGAYL